MPTPVSDLTESPATVSGKPVFKRVLIKLSGEALMGNRGYGIDPAVVRSVALQIKAVVSHGVGVSVVVGGGNIFRGLAGSAAGMDRTTADTVGMLATIMNALTLQDSLEKEGIITRVQTAIEMSKVAEPFIRRKAIRHLEKGRVVIFAAGTGNPYFSTDTGAALRAAEINADVIFKATKVDGVYTSDPVTNPDAVRYTQISYMDVIKQGIKVMDTTAISLCMENSIPILVFRLEDENMERAIMGEPVGTLVGGKENE
ncbi:MAG: UMP kinase [Candidatus Sericytochromatia bacterium]|jgi:uridylate kinase|nr:UMP kinase [Candidatus Sericytochromatia bacterium]